MTGNILRILALIMFFVLSVSCTAEVSFHNLERKEQPLYVSNCEFAPEYSGWDEASMTLAKGYFPAGTPLYNWSDQSDSEEIPDGYYLLDWRGETTCIPAEYLSSESEAEPGSLPVFVDYCEECITIRKKPRYSADKIGELELGTRIDYWKVYDSEFLYVEIDGTFGYVALDYIRFPHFSKQEKLASIGNCQEWVSLRAEADVESDRLMKVPLGTQIQMYECFDDDFYICSVDGVIGYIYDYYIIEN